MASFGTTTTSQVSGSSTNLTTEQDEMTLLEDACREFIIGDAHTESNRMLTPRDWINFRNDIKAMGEVEFGNDKIIAGENDVLMKKSNMEPVCTFPCQLFPFPSCFSSEGTSKNENTRCNKHIGLIKFATMELEFTAKERTIGLDALVIMFVAQSDDNELDMKRKMIQEFKRSKLIPNLVKQLRECKFVADASALIAPDAIVPVRRFWIYDDMEEAIKKTFVLFMATVLFSMASQDYRETGLPTGPLVGIRVVRLHGATIGGVMVSEMSPSSMREEVKKEQLETFGGFVDMGPSKKEEGEDNDGDGKHGPASHHTNTFMAFLEPDCSLLSLLPDLL